MTRKDIIKALECINGTLVWCDECPYGDNRYDGVCKVMAAGDAIDLLDDGNMVRVVRCAECMHWELNDAEEGDYSGRCRYQYGPCQNQETDGTWFCADGVRIGE